MTGVPRPGSKAQTDSALMPEESVRRLKIRREERQIRVVIPVRINARALRDSFFPLVLVIFLLAGGLGVGQIVASKHTGWAGWSDLASVALGLIVGEFTILLTRRTTLTLTPEQLMLESRSGIYRRKTEKFLRQHLSDLKFVKWEPGVYVCNNWKQDELQFEQDGLIHSFAAGISEAEASVLMNEMMKILQFPSKHVSCAATGSEL